MEQHSHQYMWWTSLGQDFPQQMKMDRRAAEISRLQAAVGARPSNRYEDAIQRLRRAAALLELGQVDLSASAVSVRIWETVALIHETVGILEQIDLEYEWLLSILSWQLANQPSIASVMASRLLRQDSFDKRDHVEKLAIAFSSRDFKQLQHYAKLALNTGYSLRESAVRENDFSTAIEAVIVISIAQAMDDLANYVLFNSDVIPNYESITECINLVVAENQSRRYRIGKLLRPCLEGFLRSSSRITISDVPALRAATRHRIQIYLSQYPELWPSQREAITAGLLDSSRRYFVVAVPTSSGKTLCGELAIIQSLSDNPDSVCFYIVPTRALVFEKTQELSRKLRQFDFHVAGATGALQQDVMESSLLGDARVVVCTPEKLDLLLRHDDPVLAFPSLFVIDETHMVADNDRGLGLEFVVIKLLLLKSTSRILLLSAVLPNYEQFGRWLAAEARVTSSAWRPTRQRFGEITFRPLSPRGAGLEMLTYDPAGPFDELRLQLRTYTRRPRSGKEKVVWTIDALKEKGSILVFCMSKSRCEEIAQELVNYYSLDSSYHFPTIEVEMLRNKIHREIADDFLLAKALEVGVAYHHADLPPGIRVELESLIAAGHVTVVVSTTTLAEGVNLPLSTVIFESWMTRGDARIGRRSEPLDVSKFLNIAGRAGRAGQEVEGLVLFLEPGDHPIVLPNGTVVSPRDYFLRNQYPPVLSRFLEIVGTTEIPTDLDLDNAWLEGDEYWRPTVRRSLRQFGSAVLHAIEVVNMSDSAIVDQFVERSLLAIQAPGQVEKAKNWFRTWVRFYRRTIVGPPELRPLAMQVGLSLRTIQLLYSRAISDELHTELHSHFLVDSTDGFILTEAQAAIATRIVSEIGELDWEPLAEGHNELLTLWINGASFIELASSFQNYIPEQTRLVERTCSYAVQKLSNSGSWGMYALVRILEIVLGGKDRLSSVTKHLPLLTYFGVNSVPAALFSLIGIERIDALRLGAEYLREGYSADDIPFLKGWAVAAGRARLEEIIRGADRRSIDEDTFRILGL